VDLHQPDISDSGIFSSHFSSKPRYRTPTRTCVATATFRQLAPLPLARALQVWCGAGHRAWEDIMSWKALGLLCGFSLGALSSTPTQADRKAAPDGTTITNGHDAVNRYVMQALQWAGMTRFARPPRLSASTSNVQHAGRAHEG
jgi:hypothetical protein